MPLLDSTAFYIIHWYRSKWNISGEPQSGEYLLISPLLWLTINAIWWKFEDVHIYLGPPTEPVSLTIWCSRGRLKWLTLTVVMVSILVLISFRSSWNVTQSVHFKQQKELREDIFFHPAVKKLLSTPFHVKTITIFTIKMNEEFLSNWSSYIANGI